MSNIAYRVSRNKRKLILDWLNTLHNNANVSWPVHSMSATDWFNLFCEMHPPGFVIKTFHNIKYFNLQMNSIVEMNLFPGLVKRVIRHPKYSVSYILNDVEVTGSTNTNSNRGKYLHIQLLVFKFISITFLNITIFLNHK